MIFFVVILFFPKKNKGVRYREVRYIGNVHAVPKKSVCYNQVSAIKVSAI